MDLYSIKTDNRFQALMELDDSEYDNEYDDYEIVEGSISYSFWGMQWFNILKLGFPKLYKQTAYYKK